MKKMDKKNKNKNKTEKIIPKSLAKKKGLLQKENQALVRFSSISLILSAVAIFIEGYLAWSYFGKDLYANYSLLLLFLGIVSVSGAFWLNPKAFVLNDYYLKDEKAGLQFFSLILGTMACVGMMQALLKVPFRLALSTTDLYLYFVASAIIEELFFRMFLIGIFETKTKLKWAGLFIAAFVFALFHIPTYWPNVEILLAMFLGGIIFGFFFVASKDVTITMIAHICINLIVVGSLLMQTGSIA